MIILFFRFLLYNIEILVTALCHNQLVCLCWRTINRSPLCLIASLVIGQLSCLMPLAVLFKRFCSLFERQTAMAALRVLAFLALIGASSAAVSSSETTDFSYADLINHLNLASSSDLSIMRAVKRWTTPTAVFVDMLLYAIVEVVSLRASVCEFKG